MASSMKGFEELEIQLEEIKSATNNFDEKNVIGNGGFGKVYKGELSHSHSTGKSMVALKRLDRRHGQGDAEFYKEVRMLSCYTHENIISLLGFSRGRDEMILVYEYASRGSLDSYLKDVNLTWTQRLKICLDAAKGLSYLHDPRDTYQRLIHCDIKSANILLDENFKAKVSDFGLSKIGPANQKNSILVTGALGTPGYCDPAFMETYTLTKESDIYSFGVVLFEVLCGKLCVEYSKGQLKVIHVPMWKQSYEQKQLDRIILEDIKQQMNQGSLETFSGIAYQCLKRLREERPTMSLVVEKLEIALQMQVLPKEYIEIANAAVDPLLCRSMEEFKKLLSKGVLLNGGKTWLSLNDKEEHHVLVSIDEYLSLDDQNREYRDRYSSEKSRFAVGCYKTRLVEFKLHVRTPLFLSPDVTYGLNLVLHYSERERMKQQHVGVRYKIQGETKISILHFADKNEIEDTKLVAELYQFNSTEESILDLEILLEDCGISDYFYIEGIEFQPLERVEVPVVVANKEIVRAVVPPLFYGLTEEPEVLLSQGVLLNEGKMWLSINDKGELCVLISIEDCMIRDDSNGDNSDNYSFEKNSRAAVGCYKAYMMNLIEDCMIQGNENRDNSDKFSSEKNSRFAVGCYYTKSMNFIIHVETPLFLSPRITYGLNLIFQYRNKDMMNQQYLPIKYKLQGETKISIVHFTDMREDEWLVARLYIFSGNDKHGILGLEIIFEDCGLSGDFYIEGIEFQPLGRLEHQMVVVEYEEILKAAVTPLCYTSAEELKLLLTRGILLDGCKTWFCINEKGEHIEIIYIESCLEPNERIYSYYVNSRIWIQAFLNPDEIQHPSDEYVNSRFPGGRCYEYNWGPIKASVRGQYLTPQISYTLNLVFRYKDQSQVNSYNPLRYKLYGDDEAKVFIIHPTTHMREDGWFIAPLYQFTSQQTTADLQFELEYHHIALLVAGFEFQPLEEIVELHNHQVFKEYQDILKAASQSLVYKYSMELKQILSKGIHLNGYKTWFSLNEKGEHCEMISMKDCLIPNEDFSSRMKSHWSSRFPAGYYQASNKGFKTHVKPQFLSPLITYTVNLVFGSSSYGEQAYVDLKYRLRGETTTFTVYLAKRTDELFYMAELYQFTSDGSIVDLEILFDDCDTNIGVEGILFQPLEIVEDPLLKDDKVEDIQAKSDSGILKLSNNTEKKAIKKNLYSALGKWFQFNNDIAQDDTAHDDTAHDDTAQEWSYLNKNEKKCVMLSARVACFTTEGHFTWRFLPESRFGEVLVITAGNKFEIASEIKFQALSPKTRYASYLVFKLPQDQSKFEYPLQVLKKNDCSWDIWFVYLVNPPHTPVIGPKFDENSYNPLDRHKLNTVPRQRRDGWMEVKVWEFEMWKSSETVLMHLHFEHPGKKDLCGLIIHGIELRPYKLPFLNDGGIGKNQVHVNPSINLFS